MFSQASKGLRCKALENAVRLFYHAVRRPSVIKSPAGANTKCGPHVMARTRSFQGVAHPVLFFGFQLFRDHPGAFVYVAAAHGQHQIPLVRMSRHIVADFLEGG